MNIKVIPAAVCFILLSCTNDNEPEIDCRLFDPVFPSLFLRLVDENGANLFENGRIDPDSLRVTGDFEGARFVFNPANEFANPDADIRKLDNTIGLGISNQSNFQYTIFISNQDSVVVDFTAKFTEIPCNLFYYTPLSANYNNIEIQLIEVSPLQFIAELLLPLE